MIHEIRSLLESSRQNGLEAVDPSTRRNLAAWVCRTGMLRGFERSVLAIDGCVLFLAQGPRGKCLVHVSEPGPCGDDLPGGETAEVDGLAVRWMPADGAAAMFLRGRIPHLQPRLIGLSKSFGFGDRLGIATPGHVRALGDRSIQPLFAQQSIRELARTGRTPADVINDAALGLFQEGYQEGYGSDADHLKTPADVDACLAAGFTLFTFDPGDFVDDDADTDDAGTLERKVEGLPWQTLRTSADDLRRDYVGREFALPDGSTLAFDEETLVRAAAKYGSAVAHVSTLFEHLAAAAGDRPFEVEVSVDETATPTSPEEHFFIAGQLRRLGVQWVSLAPRFVGDMEKGVDYKGDLGRFRASLARHVAIARALAPYKISLHSGSDKFSIYPIIAELAGELLHVKTAGTSYLEAVRAIARVDTALFREILALALDRYDEDRRTYHVSADPARVPAPDHVPDADLPALLDDFDARQVLHVTFGTVLTLTDAAGAFVFRDRLMSVLREDEEIYFENLERHLGRHVELLAGA